MTGSYSPQKGYFPLALNVVDDCAGTGKILFASAGMSTTILSFPERWQITKFLLRTAREIANGG